MAPDATTEEIRAAFRARARELHPDRRGNGAPTGSATRDRDGDRDREMIAVNRAWETLRDPDRRAAYDRALARGTRPDTSPTGDAMPRRSPAHPPPVHHPAPGCLATLGGVGPWIVVLVLLALIFVFTAYAGSGDDGRPSGTSEPPLVAVRDLRGSCIGLAGGATIVVDCFTVPHEGVIVAQASVGASCPEGTVEWLIRQQRVLACTERGTEVRE